MTEWIEFKMVNNESSLAVQPLALRRFDIARVVSNGEQGSIVCLDGEHGARYYLAESYEEVLGKLKAAEEESQVDLTQLRVERFTDAEYAALLEMAETFADPRQKVPDAVHKRLIEKLKNILKEDK